MATNKERTPARRVDDHRATGKLQWGESRTTGQAAIKPTAASAPSTADDQWIYDLAAEHEANRDGLYGPVTFDASGLLDFARAILATQSAKQGAAQATLDRIADIFQICELARSESTILANVRNTIRREECLSAVEHTFFMVPAEPDDDYPDEDPGEECLLGWGREPKQYVEQFRAALQKLSAPTSHAPASSEQAAQVQADVRDQALEEAATCIDTFVSEQLDPERMECGRGIAVAIRAMKSRRPATSEGEKK